MVYDHHNENVECHQVAHLNLNIKMSTKLIPTSKQCTNGNIGMMLTNIVVIEIYAMAAQNRGKREV